MACLGKRLREHEQFKLNMRFSIRIPTFSDTAWISVQGDFPAGENKRLANIVKKK